MLVTFIISILSDIASSAKLTEIKPFTTRVGKAYDVEVIRKCARDIKYMRETDDRDDTHKRKPQAAKLKKIIIDTLAKKKSNVFLVCFQYSLHVVRML